MIAETVRNAQSKATTTTASKPTKHPRKQATKPTAAAKPSPVAAVPMTTAERAEALSKLSQAETALFAELVAKVEAGDDYTTAKAWYETESAKLEAAKPAPVAVEQNFAEPMPAETTDPFDSDHLTFCEPETYLQPVGTLARYALAHMLMGEFGEWLFGSDYLDADGFEKLHGLYIDLRAGIAHGFPHMEIEKVKPAILACESKFFL